MICHALSTGALFIIAGALQERLHTRDVADGRALGEGAPHGGGRLFFALASLGLPGLGNFMAEFMILLGAFQASYAVAAVASFGLIVSTIYALSLVQRVFHGPNLKEWVLADLGGRELVIIGVLVVAIVWLGFYPQPVLNTAGEALTRIVRSYSAEETRTIGIGVSVSSVASLPRRVRTKAEEDRDE